MQVNKDQQNHGLSTLKKKFHQGQYTRKTNYFKKKQRRSHMRPKIVLENNLSGLPNMLPIEKLTNLSISPELSKKNKQNPLDITTNTDPTLLLVDYLTISDTNFKEMLLKLVSNDADRNILNELLNKEDLFLFIRQLTQLVNKLNYFQLQYQQWSYYYQVGTSEGIWTGRVSKKMALDNSMCLSYGRSRTLIEQRVRKYKQQLKQVQHDINEYVKNTSVFIDISKIIDLINCLIHKDQYVLRVEFERRKVILRMDAQEHQLIKEFYGLKPERIKIYTAKKIWNATSHEQTVKYEIAMFKKCLISNRLNAVWDLRLPNISHILTQLTYQQQQTSVQDIATETFAKAEELGQTYKQKAFQEKTKLLHRSSNPKDMTKSGKILELIMKREQNIIERFQYDTTQKLLILSNHTETPITNEAPH